MSISISSALSTAAATAANSTQNETQGTQGRQPQPQQTTNNAGYTVQLSEAQQVYQLYNQGQQVPQIAAALNLSVPAVNNYLGITSSNTQSG
jgi:DNA-binding NarL/FixJ family response regulator